MAEPDLSTFASSLEEAKERYEKYELNDPFPKISSSLLNSADIADYVRITGMIYPFDPKYLKPATLALTIGGPYIYWDAKGNKKEGTVSKGKTMILEKDSILFLTIGENIQLPQYIAARFNLKIDNVYRGLLLGTGPMVDPGFKGRLSIPLHNFTSNEYHLKGGETIIWMEFTKVSDNIAWQKSMKNLPQKGEFVRFKSDNTDKNVGDYLSDADSRSVQSSIPLSVVRSERAAKNARRSAWILSGVNVALMLAVIVFCFSALNQMNSFYSTAKKDEKEYQSTLIYSDSVKVKAIRVEIDSLNARVSRLKK